MAPSTARSYCVFCLSVLSVVVCWLLCRGRGRRVLARQPLDARLRGSMRANSTYGQYGMMGIWMLRVASASEVATAALDTTSVFAGMVGAAA